MPLGKTARIQQADRQHFKHLNQIKIKCENELNRETKCLEELFRLEMLHHDLEHQHISDLLHKIHHICHRRDAALKRSFETILQRFSFSSIYDSDPSLTFLPRLSPPKTAPPYLNKSVKTPSICSPVRRRTASPAKINMRLLTPAQRKASNSFIKMLHLTRERRMLTPRNKAEKGRSSRNCDPERGPRNCSSGSQMSPAQRSWQKLAITLPKCDSEELAALAVNHEPVFRKTDTRRNPQSNMGPTGSTSSLRQIRGVRSKIEPTVSQFQVPACIATKPIPKARDRYLEAVRYNASLTNIRECNYLRVS